MHRDLTNYQIRHKDGDISNNELDNLELERRPDPVVPCGSRFTHIGGTTGPCIYVRGHAGLCCDGVSVWPLSGADPA